MTRNVDILINHVSDFCPLVPTFALVFFYPVYIKSVTGVSIDVSNGLKVDKKCDLLYATTELSTAIGFGRIIGVHTDSGKKLPTK